MRRIPPRSCARAMSGTAAAPPRPAMKSRRLKSVSMLRTRHRSDLTERFGRRLMSASLIGRLGSSTFRLSTTAMSMSPRWLLLLMLEARSHA